MSLSTKGCVLLRLDEHVIPIQVHSFLATSHVSFWHTRRIARVPRIIVVATAIVRAAVPATSHVGLLKPQGRERQAMAQPRPVPFRQGQGQVERVFERQPLQCQIFGCDTRQGQGLLGQRDIVDITHYDRGKGGI
jgi:hypothetical protein